MAGNKKIVFIMTDTQGTNVVGCCVETHPRGVVFEALPTSEGGQVLVSASF